MSFARGVMTRRFAGAVCAFVSAASVLGPSTPAGAADLPPYMNTIVGTSPGNAADTATRNVLMLNTIMFDLYGDAAKIFTKNILAQHPVILALFSGAGGRMIPIALARRRSRLPRCRSVPVEEIVAHSTMARPGRGPVLKVRPISVASPMLSIAAGYSRRWTAWT